uniref:Uncharacterized protein n=1 Tax=Ananas comosus var. bracteatus TaxID=296719 RepID=A0A6V7NQA7_ANACO|nr:unnamed protein product [Ananas comosus var. bracteatus]
MVIFNGSDEILTTVTSSGADAKVCVACTANASTASWWGSTRSGTPTSPPRPYPTPSPSSSSASDAIPTPFSSHEINPPSTLQLRQWRRSSRETRGCGSRRSSSRTTSSSTRRASGVRVRLSRVELRERARIGLGLARQLDGGDGERRGGLPRRADPPDDPLRSPRLVNECGLPIADAVDILDLAAERTGRRQLKQMGIAGLAAEIMEVEVRKPSLYSLSDSSRCISCTTSRSLIPHNEDNNIWQQRLFNADSAIDEHLDVVPRGLHLIYVDKSRRRYLVSSNFIDHPLFHILIERSDGREGTSSAMVIGCEVVLFRCLLWMLRNGDELKPDDLAHQLFDETPKILLRWSWRRRIMPTKCLMYF